MNATRQAKPPRYACANSRLIAASRGGGGSSPSGRAMNASSGIATDAEPARRDEPEPAEKAECPTTTALP